MGLEKRDGGGPQEPQIRGTIYRKNRREAKKKRYDNGAEMANGENGDTLEDPERGGGRGKRTHLQVDWTTHYGDKRDKQRGEAPEVDAIRFGTYNINTFPKLGSIKSRRLSYKIWIAQG